MNNAAIIYALCEPDGQTIRYVGKTSPGREKARFKRHLHDKVIHHTRKTNWLGKLKRDGLRPVMKTLAVVPASDWEYWEIRFIRELSKHFNLTNSDEGGRDPGKRSAEVVARVTARLNSDEVRAKVRGVNHHFNRDPVTRANHAAAVSTEEYRDQFRGESNPMNANPEARAKQKAAVNRPEQKAVRRDNMNKLHSDPAFNAAHIERLRARSAIIARGNLLFCGADAACRYFGISKPTLTKFVTTGQHGFAKEGFASDTPAAIIGGYAVEGVWHKTTPSAAEKLQHGGCGKPSNFKGHVVPSE